MKEKLSSRQPFDKKKFSFQYLKKNGLLTFYKNVYIIHLEVKKTFTSEKKTFRSKKKHLQVKKKHLQLKKIKRNTKKKSRDAKQAAVVIILRK